MGRPHSGSGIVTHESNLDKQNYVFIFEIYSYNFRVLQDSSVKNIKIKDVQEWKVNSNIQTRLQRRFY